MRTSYIYIGANIHSGGDTMPEEMKSCKLGEKTVCPRCNHAFVPDEELVEEQNKEKEGGRDELNALISCPVCGAKMKLNF
jgi:rubredoxin